MMDTSKWINLALLCILLTNGYFCHKLPDLERSNNVGKAAKSRGSVVNSRQVRDSGDRGERYDPGARSSGSGGSRSDCPQQPTHGVIAHGPKGETLCLPLSPDKDHRVVNPGGLTVLIGTGGAKQTVYGTGKIQGPLRVIPSPQKISGVSQQTVYSPTGGTVVLVGTGGPTQTVHHAGTHDEHHTAFDHDGYPIHDKNLDNQRGDQPGHLIPGYSRVDDSLPSSNGRDRNQSKDSSSSSGSREDSLRGTTPSPFDDYDDDRGGDPRGRGNGSRTSDRHDDRGSGQGPRGPGGYDRSDDGYGSRNDQRGNQSGRGSQSGDSSRDGHRDDRYRPGQQTGDRPSGSRDDRRDQPGFRPGSNTGDDRFPGSSGGGVNDRRDQSRPGSDGTGQGGISPGSDYGRSDENYDSRNDLRGNQSGRDSHSYEGSYDRDGYRDDRYRPGGGSDGRPSGSASRQGEGDRRDQQDRYRPGQQAGDLPSGPGDDRRDQPGFRPGSNIGDDKFPGLSTGDADDRRGSAGGDRGSDQGGRDSGSGFDRTVDGYDSRNDQRGNQSGRDSHSEGSYDRDGYRGDRYRPGGSDSRPGEDGSDQQDRYRPAGSGDRSSGFGDRRPGSDDRINDQSGGARPGDRVQGGRSPGTDYDRSNDDYGSGGSDPRGNQSGRGSQSRDSSDKDGYRPGSNNGDRPSGSDRGSGQRGRDPGFDNYDSRNDQRGNQSGRGSHSEGSYDRDGYRGDRYRPGGSDSRSGEDRRDQQDRYRPGGSGDRSSGLGDRYSPGQGDRRDQQDRLRPGIDDERGGGPRGPGGYDRSGDDYGSRDDQRGNQSGRGSHGRDGHRDEKYRPGGGSDGRPSVSSNDLGAGADSRKDRDDRFRPGLGAGGDRGSYDSSGDDQRGNQSNRGGGYDRDDRDRQGGSRSGYDDRGSGSFDRSGGDDYGRNDQRGGNQQGRGGSGYGENYGPVGSRDGSGSRDGPRDGSGSDKFRPGSGYGDHDRPLTSWGQKIDHDGYPLGPNDRRGGSDRDNDRYDRNRGDGRDSYRPGGGRDYDRDNQGGRYGGSGDRDRYNERDGDRQGGYDRGSGDSGSRRRPGGADDGSRQPAPENLADDDSFSEAETSIKGGEVSATAQGTKNGGTAQTQVSGTYTGKGSFSATAQTSDKDRSAKAQISGGKEGASTSAQGQGGEAKSQSQISVDSKTGGTSATSQSGGKAHESKSEVVADDKGGLADAEADGPGHTSSQSQISFKPATEDSQESTYSVFNGGGTASASSGSKTGQSQAQIGGKFNFGISYQGAAQAASAGTKEEVKKIRDKSRSLFRNIELFGKKNKKTETSQPEEEITKLRSKTSKTVTITSANPTLINSSSDRMSTSKPQIAEEYNDYEEGNDDEEDDDDEEEEEDYLTEAPGVENRSGGKVTTTEPNLDLSDTEDDDTTARVITQKQVPVIASHEGKPVRLVQTQNGQTFTFPPKTNHKIDKFEPPVDAHDVTISKTTQKIRYKTRYQPPKSEDTNNLLNKKSLDDPHVSITNSLSGNVDDNGDGKFESTYITKSTKCGHVTFSCNVVYGSEGRSRICRPKQPTTKC